MNPVPALLVLEDGRSFVGRSFGAEGTAFGELVFATGMSGYQETLTDPSYCGQVLLATAPHIGNTGWNTEDSESAQIQVAGLVVRDPAPRPSNWRSTSSLTDQLRQQGVVAMCDIDTRALTRHIRELGAMRVGISTQELDPQRLLAEVLKQPRMAGADLFTRVSTGAEQVIEAVGEKRLTVAALDLGIKTMTPIQLAQRGVEVHIFPAGTPFDQLMGIQPDGIFFSNGPGDPAAATGPTQVLREVLAAGVPFFGICFGHQVFGRALGLDTYKLKFGHRGINQPVIDRTTGRVEVTAQNHGFAVAAPLDEVIETSFGQVSVSHICLNDNVVEGLELRRDDNLTAFSVQYHPEAAAGPHDSNYLFDRFVDLMAAKDL